MESRFEVGSVAEICLSISIGPELFFVRIDAGGIVAGDGSCNEASSALTSEKAGDVVDSGSCWSSRDAESSLTVKETAESVDTVVPEVGLSISMGPESFFVRVDAGGIVTRDGGCNEVSSEVAAEEAGGGVDSGSWWGSRDAESSLTAELADTVVPLEVGDSSLTAESVDTVVPLAEVGESAF